MSSEHRSVAPGPRPTPAGLPLWRSSAVILMVIGIGVSIIGTFGSWVRSGSVDRNSYQAIGTLRRFPVIHNEAVLAATGVWPYLGPLLMVPLILLAFRLWRTAAVSAAVAGILVAVPSIVVLAMVGSERHFGVGLATGGPLTVIIGGAVLIAAGAVLLISSRRDVRLQFNRAGNRTAPTIVPPVDPRGSRSW